MTHLLGNNRYNANDSCCTIVGYIAAPVSQLDVACQNGNTKHQNLFAHTILDSTDSNCSFGCNVADKNWPFLMPKAKHVLISLLLPCGHTCKATKSICINAFAKQYSAKM